MSEIQGQYKINISGRLTDIYSLKFKQKDSDTPIRLECFKQPRWDVPLGSNNLQNGNTYYIKVPAHTTGVFTSSLTGFIHASSCWGVNTQNTILTQTGGNNYTGFGYCNGDPICRGFIDSSRNNTHKFYQLDNAEYDFKAFFVYNGDEDLGDITPLKQFIYTQSTVDDYLWLKPYQIRLTQINRQLDLSALTIPSGSTLTASLNLGWLIANQPFQLYKKSGKSTDPINATSLFSQYQANGDKFIFAGALGCYTDSYGINTKHLSTSVAVGQFSDNDIVYSDEISFPNGFSVTPSGVGTQDNQMDNYDFSTETQLSFHFNVTTKKISSVVFDNQYRIYNHSTVRTIYIKYYNDQDQLQTRSISPNDGYIQIFPHTNKRYIFVFRSESVSDYQKIDLPN